MVPSQGRRRKRPLKRFTRGQVGGIAALFGVALFVVVVSLLHVLQPGYAPRDQLMSELALGRHGWAMLFAFLGPGLAFTGVWVGVSASGPARGYGVLLLATATFFMVAGVFPLGETASLHIGAISMAFVLAVLAMYLFPACSGRASASAPRWVSWTLAAGVAASVALGHSVVPMGVGQRMAAACLLLWLGVTGWRLSRDATARRH